MNQVPFSPPAAGEDVFDLDLRVVPSLTRPVPIRAIDTVIGCGATSECGSTQQCSTGSSCDPTSCSSCDSYGQTGSPCQCF